MTQTNSNVAAACAALLLTLAVFQQAIVVPADPAPVLTPTEIA